ncbi:MAG: hypothetical protein Q9N32_09005 [Gammaproteobacteria bacterium]|nr:hypothetical protein [Gammaproteobacteria bacterium]
MVLAPNSRHIIGTTVVGGMISATVIGVLFIPYIFLFGGQGKAAAWT